MSTINSDLLNGCNFSDEQKKAIRECQYKIKDVDKFILHLSEKSKAQKVRYLKIDGNKIDLTLTIDQLHKANKFSPENRTLVLKARKIYLSYLRRSENFLRSACDGYLRSESKTFMTRVESMLVEKKAFILEAFGRMFTVDEVHKMLLNDYNVSDIRIDELSVFYVENKSEIERLQEKHKQQYDHLRLTAKTSRVEELTWLYNKAKSKYEKGTNREDHKVLLQTLEALRKEVEGEKLTIQASVDVNMQQDVNFQIRNELLKNLPLREIIVGRLATKLGIQPRDIINDLSQSYYARLNSLINNVQEVSFDDIEFPSLQTYDFTAIEEKQKQIEEKQKIEESNMVKLINPISDDELQQLNIMKQAMIKKLDETSDDIRKRRNDLKNILG